MFKQLFSSTKIDRVEPYISVLSSGVVFNPSAIDEIGSENERAVVFYDKNSNRLAFCFMRAKLTGSYSFLTIPRSRSRRIGITNFLKRNNIVDRANGHEFPLKVLKETVPDFEGSTIFVANLDGKKSLSETRSALAKKQWQNPVWAKKQRKLIRAGKRKQIQNQV